MHRLHIALRVLVAIGVGGAAVLWLPAASSHHEVTFTECFDDEDEGDQEEPPEPTLTPPPTSAPSPTPTPGAEFPDNCTPPEGSIIRGERTLRFEVESGSLRPMRDVRAFLDSEDDDIESPGQVVIECSPPDQAPAQAGCQYPEGEPEGVFTFPWDSNVVTPHNGAYTFRGLALSEPHAPNPDPENENDPRIAEARRHRLLVDNPPVDLGAPSIIVATENSITLEWDPAPEPDLLSYTVYRAVTANTDTKPKAADFEAVASTTKAALRDEIDEPAAYWYRVRSTRRSVVTPDDGISSAVSPMSGPGVVGGLRATPPPEGEEPLVETGPRNPIVVPRSPGRPPPVPDAPFSAYLPFEATDLPESDDDGDTFEEVEEPGEEDPRAPFLPMAVGAFLVSSALAVGRMPF